jgi:micrococcal nuclease
VTDYVYELAEVKRIVDGDTFDLVLTRTIDFGFYLVERKNYAVRVRLYGVDTPERNENAYLSALSFAGRWFDGRTVQVRTYKTDTFGRWLADPFDAVTGERLADELVSAGLAVPYRKGRP